MAFDNAAQKTRIREAILQHLRIHPSAADTMAGIVANWLPSRGFEKAPDHIEAVLADLLGRGCLQSCVLPDGKTLYRRGEARDA